MHRVARVLGVLALLVTALWPADAHATTAVITREIAINMYEGLYALDAKYQPQPLLAEVGDA